MGDHGALAEMLPGYVNGSLPSDERAQVEQHVTDCLRCATELAAWRTISRAVASTGSVVAPDEALARVLQQIEPAPDPVASSRSRSGSAVRGTDAGKRPSVRQYVVRRAAVAAALILGLVVVALPAVRGPDPGEMLMLAAAETTAAGSARLQLDGQATVLMDASPALGGENARFALTLSGDGSVRFGEALQFRLRTTGQMEEHEHLSFPSRELERLRTPSAVYERADDGRWKLQPTQQTGVLGTAVLHPSMPDLVLGSASGPVEERGTDTVDGAPTRRLRFDLDSEALPPSPGMDLNHRAEVWIGTDDHLLRKFRITAVGPGTDPLPGHWEITLDVTLTDFGQPAHIEDPLATDRG